MEGLIRESDVSDRMEALGRPFFMGVKIFISETDPIGKVVHPSAFSEAMIEKRLKDDRFCRFCFLLIENGHDYGCRKSPWKMS
jgi:hypothetical protein